MLLQLARLQSVLKLFNKWFKLLYGKTKWIHMFKLTFLYFIGRYIYNKLYRIYYSLPPGPEGPFPKIGSMMYIIMSPNKYHIDLAQQYGDISCVFELGQTLIMINDSSLAKQILSNQNAMNHYEAIFDNLQAFNIFAADDNTAPMVFLNGKEWIKMRRLMHSKLIRVLNSKIVSDVINECVMNEFKPKLDFIIESSELWHPIELLTYLTFAVVIRANFGKSVSLSNNKICRELVTDLSTILSFNGDIAKRGMVLIMWPRLGPKLLPRSFFQPVYDLRRRIHNNIKSLMTKRDSEATVLKESYFNALRELAEDEDSTYTETQEIADIYFMFLAGTETTATVIEWGLVLLAQQQHIQNKIRNELLTVFNKNGIDYTMPSNLLFDSTLLLQVPLYRAAIYEILRISCPVRIGVAHQVSNQDIWITTSNGKKYRLPVGAMLTYNVNYFHYNNKKGTKEHWKNIDKNPQQIYLNNWLDDDKKFDLNPSFFTFGFGKRDCSGRALAIKEIRIILAYLLCSYQFSLEDKYKNMAQVPCKGGVRYGVARPVPAIPLIVKKYCH